MGLLKGQHWAELRNEIGQLDKILLRKYLVFMVVTFLAKIMFVGIGWYDKKCNLEGEGGSRCALKISVAKADKIKIIKDYYGCRR
ncbi:MAG: hypothetical protein IK092_04850 [Muribaculaceae bacterium]|nr:hypothetical protein [Muribaculaceae bacterium]